MSEDRQSHLYLSFDNADLMMVIWVCEKANAAYSRLWNYYCNQDHWIKQLPPSLQQNQPATRRLIEMMALGAVECQFDVPWLNELQEEMKQTREFVVSQKLDQCLQGIHDCWSISVEKRFQLAVLDHKWMVLERVRNILCDTMSIKSENNGDELKIQLSDIICSRKILEAVMRPGDPLRYLLNNKPSANIDQEPKDPLFSPRSHLITASEYLDYKSKQTNFHICHPEPPKRLFNDFRCIRRSTDSIMPEMPKVPDPIVLLKDSKQPKETKDFASAVSGSKRPSILRMILKSKAGTRSRDAPNTDEATDDDDEAKEAVGRKRSRP